MNTNEEVTEYINEAPLDQIELLKDLRDLIHRAVPEAREDIKWQIPVFSKLKIFSYLRKTKSYVAIGFYNIDRINDQENLLEGTGKTMRHLKIRRKEDINEELIMSWLIDTAV